MTTVSIPIWEAVAVLTDDEVLGVVDEAFASGPLGGDSWADPNPGRTPDEAAYSRFTNPERYQVLLARVDAWIAALEQLGAASVERDVSVEWAERAGGQSWRVDRVVPIREGTLPIAVGRMSCEDVLDTGVILGCGEPVIEIERFPDCACDACDSGSDDLLEYLDEYMLAIVTGRFRLLSRRKQLVVRFDNGRGRARNVNRSEDVLADPTGWQDFNGPAWLP